MAWTQDEINKCIEDCKVKALTDSEFRKLLIADPGAAVKSLTGKDIPAGYKIKVLESDPAFDATFVLPPMVSGNLSDKDLDNVAGGICGMETCAMNACAAYASAK